MAGSMQGFFILMNPLTLSNYVISVETWERVGGMELLGRLQSLEGNGSLVELDTGGESQDQKAYYHRLESAYESLMKEIFNSKKGN